MALRMYVGAGSHLAPEPILKFMRLLAKSMNRRGVTLRCSDQPGPDRAFLTGSNGRFFKYLADEDWEGTTVCGMPPDMVFSGSQMILARKITPGFVTLPESEKRWELTANSLLLGPNGELHAKLLVCWTPDGATCPAEFTEQTGHTARYIRVAHAAGIRVYNLARREHRNMLMPKPAPATV